MLLLTNVRNLIRGVSKGLKAAWPPYVSSSRSMRINSFSLTGLNYERSIYLVPVSCVVVVETFCLLLALTGFKCCTIAAFLLMSPALEALYVCVALSHCGGEFFPLWDQEGLSVAALDKSVKKYRMS